MHPEYQSGGNLSAMMLFDLCVVYLRSDVLQKAKVILDALNILRKVDARNQEHYWLIPSMRY